jgi:hypothetical protein
MDAGGQLGSTGPVGVDNKQTDLAQILENPGTGLYGFASQRIVIRIRLGRDQSSFTRDRRG